MHECLCTRAHVCLSVCLCVHACAHTCACVYVTVFVCVCVCVCVCVRKLYTFVYSVLLFLDKLMEEKQKSFIEYQSKFGRFMKLMKLTCAYI